MSWFSGSRYDVVREVTVGHRVHQDLEEDRRASCGLGSLGHHGRQIPAGAVTGDDDRDAAAGDLIE